MAWLTGWNYQKKLNVSSTNSVTNYQMKITVNYGSGTDGPGNIYCNYNVKTDFSDIRFTDTDGTTLLSYWIESSIASSSATVWVKIPNIPTGTNSTYIFFYYNNISATTASNGANTFAFFDDFIGSSVDTGKWAGTTSGSGISVANSVISYVGSGTWRTMSSTNTYREGSYSLRTKANFVGSSPVNAELGFQPTPCCNGRTIIYGYGYLCYDDSGNGQNSGAIYSSAWYIFDIFINGGANAAFYRNGILDYNATTYVPSGNLLQPALMGAGFLNHEVDVDWVLIRKYASPEPIWGTVQSVTLNINSTPTGAEVWFASPSGSAWADQHVNTNTILYVPGGSYDVELGLNGYQLWTLYNQTYTAGQTYNIIATLSPQPGSLSISSTPTGSEIYFALQPGVATDQHMATPSGTISNLGPGIYNITLKLAEYQDWTGTATVSSNTTTTILATFAGSAYITSTPTNSSVYLDGSLTPTGTTPLTIANLTPATSDGTRPTQSHNYILKLTGYADISGSFTAIAGSTVNVPVTFPGSLYISSIPTGAQIYIDGVLQL